MVLDGLCTKCCCWPCKGSKNSANHNNFWNIKRYGTVVVDPVKVVKIQLITTEVPTTIRGGSCCWPCKGSKNSANHNAADASMTRTAVVVDPVKVVKIQLITTRAGSWQRVKGCCWPCKGSKNSANHNIPLLTRISVSVVVDPVKVVKIQLITTEMFDLIGFEKLLLTL